MFCECVSDVIRLLQLGYISGSPQHPRTGFSIRLIQFHHNLWNNTVFLTTGFIDGLMTFLDERCASRLKPRTSHQTQSKNINRSLRHPFTQAVDIYWQILLGQERVFEEGLQFTPLDISANQCLRCFGPAEGEEKMSPNEPDFIIAIDGNFQHRHQAHASKDRPDKAKYPPFFICPSKLDTQVIACKATNSQAANINVCISFFHFHLGT